MKYLQEVLRGVKRLNTDDNRDDKDADVNDVDDLLGNGNDEFRVGDERETQTDDDIDLDPEDDYDQQGGEAGADSEAPWDNLVGGATSGGPVDGTEPQGQDQTDGSGEVPQDSEELDTIADKATEDPDRQGVIRAVKGAHLVYKRESQDGGFEELWIYNVDNLQDEMTIRKAILSGTDIPMNSSSSPDGSQTYKMWSAGNAEMILISGLPN